MLGKRLRVSGGFCIMAAFLILLVPARWLLAAAAAALFHEACHYTAILLCAGNCGPVTMYSFAAKLPLPAMSRGREVLCALAGPIGGLSLLLFANYVPRIALCATMQSAYNLLPIYPLDGGRALRSGLLLFFTPPKAASICGILEMLCKFGICILALYGCFYLKLGLFPLLLAALLLIRVK